MFFHPIVVIKESFWPNGMTEFTWASGWRLERSLSARLRASSKSAQSKGGHLTHAGVFHTYERSKDPRGNHTCLLMTTSSKHACRCRHNSPNQCRPRIPPTTWSSHAPSESRRGISRDLARRQTAKVVMHPDMDAEVSPTHNSAEKESAKSY